MKRLILECDEPTTLAEAPTGLFYFGTILAMKTEYLTKGHPDCFLVESGEAFWGGVSDLGERDALEVVPVRLTWAHEEDE